MHRACARNLRRENRAQLRNPSAEQLAAPCRHVRGCSKAVLHSRDLRDLARIRSWQFGVKMGSFCNCSSSDCCWAAGSLSWFSVLESFPSFGKNFMLIMPAWSLACAEVQHRRSHKCYRKSVINIVLRIRNQSGILPPREHLLAIDSSRVRQAIVALCEACS